MSDALLRRPAGARRVAVLVAAFVTGWRQFWQGYWRSPIGC